MVIISTMKENYTSNTLTFIVINPANLQIRNILCSQGSNYPTQKLDSASHLKHLHWRYLILEHQKQPSNHQLITGDTIPCP